MKGRVRAKLILIIVILFGETCNEVWAGDLGAAVAKIVITPPVGHQIWGAAGLRGGPSDGVLDPLHARILVLKSAETSLAIVSLDLGRTFGPEQMAELRARVKAESGIEHVIFAASHTHTGPTLLNEKYIPPNSQRWEPQVLDAIARAR